MTVNKKRKPDTPRIEGDTLTLRLFTLLEAITAQEPNFAVWPKISY